MQNGCSVSGCHQAWVNNGPHGKKTKTGRGEGGTYARPFLFDPPPRLPFYVYMNSILHRKTVPLPESTSSFTIVSLVECVRRRRGGTPPCAWKKLLKSTVQEGLCHKQCV